MDQWRYERHEDTDNDPDFTLHTVSVDAGEDGRPQDFGQQIAEGWWHGDPEQLWAATAAPVMLSALQQIRQAITPDTWHHCPIAARTIHDLCNRAIQEATTDPNNLYVSPYPEDDYPDDDTPPIDYSNAPDLTR